MINKYKVKRFCSEDLSLIENYDKAIADPTQTWVCHHRRETIYTREGLIEIGEYYNRPAAELIFLTPSEHSSIHSRGNMHFLGHSHSDETKMKMSKLRQGRQWGWVKKHNMSEEAKTRISDSMKSMRWWTDGKTCIRAKECPEGFVAGRFFKRKGSC